MSHQGTGNLPPDATVFFIITSSNQMVYHNMYDITIGIAQLKVFRCAYNKRSNRNYTKSDVMGDRVYL